MKSAAEAALRAAEIAPESSPLTPLTPTELANAQHFTDVLHRGKLYLNHNAGRAEEARQLSEEITEVLPLRRPHLVRQLERLKTYLAIWSRDVPLTWPQIADDRAGYVAYYLANQRGREIERARALVPVREWAQEMLGDPDLLVLDTETTGLEGYIVEIAVIDRDGDTIFHSLVNPQCPIEAGAQEVHGIGADEVEGAPTFSDIEPQLRELLRYRRVVIYNAAFDIGVLRREVTRETEKQMAAAGLSIQLPPIEVAPNSLLNLAHSHATWRGIAGVVAESWTRSIGAHCAMEQWAIWCGNYSEYHGSYTWQPLNGGHRALDDCRACLALLHEMASPTEEAPVA